MPVLVAVALIPFVMAAVVVAVRYPLRVVLPVYAALVPFGSGLPAGIPLSFGSLSSALGAALVLCLLLQLITVRGVSKRLSPAVPVWLLFLGVTGLTVFWSIRPGLTAYGFAVLGSLILFYVLVALVDTDHVVYRRVSTALVAGGVIAATYGLLQTALGVLPTNPKGGDPRFGYGLLGPNHTAAALLLPLAIAMAATAATAGAARRMLYGAATMLLLTGILLTGSRGGLLAAVVTFVTLLIVTPRGRPSLVALAAVGVAAVAFVLTVNPEGIGQRQAENQSSSGRTEIWKVGLVGCEQYCLLGAGWGTFGTVYATTQASVADARVLPRGIFWEPHNIALLVAVEAGVVGLAVVLLGCVLAIREASTLPASLRGPPLAGLLGLLTSGIFLSDFEFKFFWMTWAFVTLAANAASTVPDTSQTESQTQLVASHATVHGTTGRPSPVAVTRLST